MPTYETIPDFGQLTEYITQGTPVESEGGLRYGVLINRVCLADQDVISVAEKLLEDYEKVSLMRPVQDIPAEEVELVKSQLLEVYHSDVASLTTVTANPMEIVSSVAAVKSYPDWKTGLEVKSGDVYWYDKNLYQVIQSHKSQADWTPTVAKALYKRYYEPDGDPWPWAQPAGAHDAYPLGARVLFEGRVYRSKIAANVWSPAVYPAGWENLGVV